MAGAGYASGGGGSGDVTGAASSTDNALVRFNGTGGKTIQDGAWTLDDDGHLTIGDGDNINTNATTGTKFPAADTQKWGAWGVTPIVQPTLPASIGSTVDGTWDATDASVVNATISAFNSLRNILINVGIGKA